MVDSDYGILVTEPTPFGLSDLKLASELMDELEIPYGVIINRAEEDSDEILEELCQEEGIDILLKIPFKREFAHLYSDGIPFVADYPEWKDKFKTVFEQIRGVIDGKNYSN